MELGGIGNFSSRTQNSYTPAANGRRTEREEKLSVSAASWSPENPFREQGLADETWEAFYTAAEQSPLVVQSDLAQKLFAAETGTSLQQRIDTLSEQSAKVLSRGALDKAINFENARLAALQQPPMTPGEEQRLIRILKERAREELVVLGNFAALLAAHRFAPFDAAA